jgi:hypothetical protein
VQGSISGNSIAALITLIILSPFLFIIFGISPSSLLSKISLTKKNTLGKILIIILNI